MRGKKTLTVVNRPFLPEINSFIKESHCKAKKVRNQTKLPSTNQSAHFRPKGIGIISRERINTLRTWFIKFKRLIIDALEYGLFLPVRGSVQLRSYRTDKPTVHSHSTG